MTRDEIISMAREASGGDELIGDAIERFAALVAAREREECADAAREWEDNYVIEDSAPRHVDDAIRARAEKGTE